MTEERRIKDDQKFEEIRRGYIVLPLEENSPIRERYGLDKIRIYDRSLLFIQQKGDEAYMRTRHRLLREGEMLTLSEARKIYKERGIWTEEDDKKRRQLTEQLEKKNEKRDYILSRLQNCEDDTEKEKIQKELDEFDKGAESLLREYREYVFREMEIFSDTIEMLADSERQKTLLMYAVCRDEGEDEYREELRIWKDRNELEKQFRSEDISQLIAAARFYWEIRKGVGEIPFFGDTPDVTTSSSNTAMPKNSE